MKDENPVVPVTPVTDTGKSKMKLPKLEIAKFRVGGGGEGPRSTERFVTHLE